MEEEQGSSVDLESEVEPSSEAPSADNILPAPVTLPGKDQEEKADLRRSTRVKKPTQLYDPSSGTYKSAKSPYKI